ncbi:hypothetical protein TWF679_003399 [Orbilia oligospora]|uniref:Uncharacterized protein n=1 Tax=Orbilia oligospora TaxID=2813651 RepID=A0A8H8VFE0_ORBOL|nr:hypothetical protein TWF679_003399 [Orbilia oligospora]
MRNILSFLQSVHAPRFQTDLASGTKIPVLTPSLSFLRPLTPFPTLSIVAFELQELTTAAVVSEAFEGKLLQANTPDANPRDNTYLGDLRHWEGVLDEK